MANCRQSRIRTRVLLVAVAAALAAAGCRTNVPKLQHVKELQQWQSIANQAVAVQQSPSEAPSNSEAAPITIYDNVTQYWDLTPEDAIRIALSNSTILRDLGGTPVGQPGATRTLYGPALEETNARTGVEAALSAFDAQFKASTFFENNDRAINNRFLGGGTNVLTQDVGNYRFELQKQTATGTKFSLRHLVDYDANNSQGNLFPSVWTTILEGEFRQPLLQGAGVGFNRIAGPNATVQNINGVVVARLNTDISIVDFEQGLRDLVNEVENAYWDLYFSYRHLETRKRARDVSLERLKRIQARGQSNLAGDLAEQEALAEAQYFRHEMEVQNSLGGKLLEGTRSNNGSAAGTFRGTLGIHVAERRLRMLLGLPISDGFLLRPKQDPIFAKVVFDWEQIRTEALVSRPELRRQRLGVKRRELELVARRNFLLPRLDAVGVYRFRGLGNDLLNSSRQPGFVVPPLTAPRFDNAYQDLTTGDFQEWQLGLQLTVPVGYREAYNAVRNAELQIARDRAVLEEAERQIVHDLANSIADLHRAYEVCRAAFQRRLAVKRRRSLIESRDQRTNKVDVALILDVQRQEADADSEFFHALVDYMMAIKSVHFEKGSLMQYNSVFLAADEVGAKSSTGEAETLPPKTPSTADPNSKKPENSESGLKKGSENGAPAPPAPIPPPQPASSAAAKPAVR